MNEDEIPLARYVLAGGGRAADPICRVAPCIEANIERIAAVSMCCKALLQETADYCESALGGAAAILLETMNELDEAVEVLRDGWVRG